MSEYTIVNGELVSVDELMHYGVLGMKWGKRKAQYKAAQDERLLKKSYAYDKKAAELEKKSEHQHAVKDLGRSNRAAEKSAKLSRKAADLLKKSVSEDDENSRPRMEQKAQKLEYKASKLKMKADRLSKSVGYGAKAMSLSIKSDRATVMAERMRLKIAKNKSYISAMNRKMSTLTPEERKKVEQPLSELLRDIAKK